MLANYETTKTQASDTLQSIECRYSENGKNKLVLQIIECRSRDEISHEINRVNRKVKQLLSFYFAV
jgi:RNA processing factor Prp31